MIWLRSDKNDFPNINPTKKDFCFLVPWNLISRGVEKTLISCSRPAFSNSEAILITRSILLSFSQAQWQGNQSIFIFRFAICECSEDDQRSSKGGNFSRQHNGWTKHKFENIMIENKMETGHQSILRAQWHTKKHFSCSALFVRVRSTISFPTLKCNIAVFYSANNGSIFMSSLQIRLLCAATKWKQ